MVRKHAIPLGRDDGGSNAEPLLARHYDELRRIARRIIADDGRRHLFQATELVNESVLRLIRSGLESVTEREHLLALAARTMRRVLIDDARRARAAKRQAPPLMTRWPGGPAAGLDVEALDAAIAALEAFSPEHSRIVELRFGLGLSIQETARVTGLGVRTINRRWEVARAWLQDRLTQDDVALAG
jgi:RNA polymerase sigma factor (TIGR02999 family)